LYYSARAAINAGKEEDAFYLPNALLITTLPKPPRIKTLNSFTNGWPFITSNKKTGITLSSTRKQGSGIFLSSAYFN